MTKTYLIAALAAAALAVPAFGAEPLKSDLKGVTDTAIKVGWMGDETGGSASVQLPDLAGLQAYAAYINAHGGVLGRQLQIINLDDKWAPDNATVNFRRLVNDDQVIAIANIGGSQNSTPLAPAVHAAKIPVIFPVQTVDAQVQTPYFFNLIAHYADQADVIVAAAAKKVGGPSKLNMYVARLNVPSGQEFDEYAQRALKTQGARYAGTATMGATQNDYTPTVLQIKTAVEAGANYVALHGALRTAIGLLAALDKANVTVPVIGITAHAAPSLYKALSPEVIGRFTSIQSVLPPNSDSAGTRELQAYVKANPQRGDDALEPFFSLGWLTGEVLKQGIETAVKDTGGTLTRETLYRALSGKFDARGLTCQMDFTGDKMHYTACLTTFGWNGTALVPTEQFSTFDPVFQRKYGLQ